MAKGKVVGMGGSKQGPPQAQMKLDPTKLDTIRLSLIHICRCRRAI